MIAPAPFFKAAGISLPSNDIVLCQHIPRRGETTGLSWLIEADGTYHDLQLIRIKNEWLSFLDWFYHFAKEEYRLLSGRKISVSELKIKLSKIKKGKYEEHSTAMHLRRFLAKSNDEDIVTEDLLKSWPI